VKSSKVISPQCFHLQTLLSLQIERIASAEEFKDLRPRRGDKQVGVVQATSLDRMTDFSPYPQFYSDLREHSEIRFPPPRVSTSAEKVGLLMQATLAGIVMQELKNQPQQSNPVMDARSIFRAAPRLSMAMLDVALARKDGAAAIAAFEVMRSLHGKAWDASPSVLRQIDK